MWKTLLEGGESSLAAWLDALGDDAGSLRQFLAPTGRGADFVPCAKPYNCGWRIPPGELVGRCPEGECPPRAFGRHELAMVDVDWARLLESLSRALGLTGRPDRVDGLPVAAQLGWIAPVQTARFPAFFCAPTAFHPLFPGLQRFAERAAGGPFAVVVPARDYLDTDCLGLLAARKAEAVFVDEDVAAKPDGNLEATAAADRLLRFALDRAGISAPESKAVFPTPEGAMWEDFAVSEVDGHTVRVTAEVRRGGRTERESETYSFDRLGLANGSKSKGAPVVAWGFLMGIVAEYRVVPESARDWSRMKKRKERVAETLRGLTGLDGDPFAVGPGRCYTPKFKVDRDPSAAKPEPEAPKRIDRTGRVRRGGKP